MPEKKHSRFMFSLHGVKIDKVDQKYGLNSTSPAAEDDTIPVNATKIDDLNIGKKPTDIISFLDESKRMRKCTVSSVDFSKDKTSYKCFWDRNPIPEGVIPIGCPIKFTPPKATKTYHSEISKETYTITENLSNKKTKEVQKSQDRRITVDPRGYYHTDGIFCSFNCCMAYIQSPENRHNPLYRYSESLLMKMYQELNGNVNLEIVPAPNWRMLGEFGGTLSISQFRDSFNRVAYEDHGSITIPIFQPTGRMFEDQIKF